VCSREQQQAAEEHDRAIKAAQEAAAARERLEQAQQKAARAKTKSRATVQVPAHEAKRTNGLSSTRSRSSGSRTDGEIAAQHCTGFQKHHYKHMQKSNHAALDFFKKGQRGKNGYPTVCAICAAPLYAGKEETWKKDFAAKGIDAYGNKL